MRAATSNFRTFSKGVRMRVKAETPHDTAAEKTIFRFAVQLLSGPIAPSHRKRNPVPPMRVIDIRGSQTLDALHMTIFRAFDREDDHMYEFQIGGKKPMDRKALRYGLALDDAYPEEKSAKATTIAALNLKPGNLFFYWFDFGDDWWHEVRLLEINPPVKGKGRYPRIVERRGESPPQYADWEDNGSVSDDRDFLFPEIVRKIEGAAAALAEQRQDEIFSLVENFCKSHLTENYIDICEELLDAAYCTWLPLERGKAQSWAAGVVHAAGMINFLHAPDSKPHMKLRDIAQHFGVSPATMEKKSREIRDAVDAFPLDPRFCLPEYTNDGPNVWLKVLDGLIVDLREQLRKKQGGVVIPFSPNAPTSPKKKEEAPKENKKKASKKR